MKKIYFTPGPAQLYFTVEGHLKEALREDIASLSHRSKAFEVFYQSTVENLKALLNIPKESYIFFTGSATEVFERIIENLVEDESFHLVNGEFSERFFQTAVELGKNPHKFEAEPGTCPDISKILLAETHELIAVTQNETSTGAAMPVEQINQLRKSFPDQLLAVDVVSALPFTNLDYTKVDTAFFSIQKGFGLPAGLGVWIVNQRCINKAEELLKRGKKIGSYHSLPSFLSKGIKNQTPETPNVLGIYLLGKVVEDMLKKGIEQIRKETEYKAAVLYNLNQSVFKPFVKDEKFRSKTVVVLETSIPSAELIKKLDEKGIVLGGGYGAFKDKHIRIANFPTHSKEQIELLADNLESISNQ